jgi:hypothetical protein
MQRYLYDALESHTHSVVLLHSLQSGAHYTQNVIMTYYHGTLLHWHIWVAGQMLSRFWWGDTTWKTYV